MNQKKIDELLANLNLMADENMESAKDAALKFTLTNDGAAQRTAIVDNAVSETYSAVHNYIETEILGKQEK